METLYILLAIIVLFFIFSKIMNRNIKQISTTALKDLLSSNKQNHLFIDVRTPNEFKSKKIKGFKNIPLDQLKNQLKQLPADRTIVIICQSGSRSSMAARQLLKSGYKNIINVRGGMNMWR